MYSKEELYQLKKEFWEGFDCYCKRRNKGRKKWILYDTKVKGLAMKFEAKRDGAYVVMELNQRDTYTRESMYDKIFAMKTYIESVFGEPLCWEKRHLGDGERYFSRIYIQKNGIDFHRQIQWMEFFSFFYEKMSVMETVFDDIKDVVTENDINN